MATRMFERESVRFMGSLAIGVGLLAAIVAGQKPGTVASVPLAVTIEEFDSNLGTTQIRGDGLGPYTDGVDSVAAKLDQDGNLIVDFQTRRTALRQVIFDFSRPVAPQNSVPPSGAQGNVYLSTLPQVDGTKVYTQNMAVGTEQCVKLVWTFGLDDAAKTSWRVSFHRGGVIDVAGTSYGVVTRTGPDTWEVEPKAAACNAENTPTLAKVNDTPTKGSFNFTDHGSYYMPFKLTLRRR